jgi:hypothetical protein
MIWKQKEKDIYDPNVHHVHVQVKMRDAPAAWDTENAKNIFE